MKQLTKHIAASIVSLLLILTMCLFPAEGLQVYAASSGTATWCIELFTIGGGYLVEPVQMEIRPGENSARQLIRLLHNNGYVGYYDGTLDNQFYLAYVGSGSQTKGSYNGYQNSRIQNGAPSNPKTLNIKPKVPAVLDRKISQALENGDAINYYDQTDYVAGYLGEFDIANGSGWMYSVNNVFPGVGFADTYLSDGDVVRVQFTLAYGNDIGGGQSVGSGYGSPYYAVANKDRLTKVMAEARASAHFSDSSVKNAYNTAKTVMAQVDASQSSVDAAYNTLSTALKNAGTTQPPATTDPEDSGNTGSSSGTTKPSTTPPSSGAASSQNGNSTAGSNTSSSESSSSEASSDSTSASESAGSESAGLDDSSHDEETVLNNDPSSYSGASPGKNTSSGGFGWIGWLILGIVIVCAGAGAAVIILYQKKKWIFANREDKDSGRRE